VEIAADIAADRNLDFPQKTYQRIKICHPLPATASVGKSHRAARAGRRGA